MGKLTLFYEGSTILQLEQSGNKTLKTSKKYCNDNITLQYISNDDSKENEIIERTISYYNNNTITQIGSYVFAYCQSLSTASFPLCNNIYTYAFQSCVRLTKLYLMNSSVATLSASNALTATPIGGYSYSAGTYGSIYVPSSLLTSYKAATNWTYFSNRFVGI